LSSSSVHETAGTHTPPLPLSWGGGHHCHFPQVFGFSSLCIGMMTSGWVDYMFGLEVALTMVQGPYLLLDWALGTHGSVLIDKRVK
jgi:hypothetical protein